jgi:hypothetical protein
MATVKKVKKAADGIKATKDSTSYYRKQGNKAAYEMSSAETPVGMSIASNKIAAATKNEARQKLKGKPGYDANGFPKKKMRTGGKTIKKAQAGLSVPPSKPVGPIDPKGAWTKVQERTIAGKKAAKVPLKKDKQLGARKMKKK